MLEARDHSPENEVSVIYESLSTFFPTRRQSDSDAPLSTLAVLPPEAFELKSIELVIIRRFPLVPMGWPEVCGAFAAIPNGPGSARGTYAALIR
jgi:hypothetical protein